MFLVDYATRKVVWQDDDASWVPPTLRVFVDWALNRKGVPAELRRQTQAAVDRFSGDFTFGVLGGAQPSLGKAFVEKPDGTGGRLQRSCGIGRGGGGVQPGP